MSAAAPHVDQDALVAYWLGELDEARTQALDKHLLGCDACGERLDGLLELADGVRRAFDAGFVAVSVGTGFVQRLAERGLRLREHCVERNGAVACSVAPDDDVLIARLQLAPEDLASVERLDIVRRTAGEPEARASDVPFDAASGEIVLVAPAARVRQLPSGVEELRLLAVDAAGERLLGAYRFDHRAGE